MPVAMRRPLLLVVAVLAALVALAAAAEPLGPGDLFFNRWHAIRASTPLEFTHTSQEDCGTTPEHNGDLIPASGQFQVTQFRCVRDQEGVVTRLEVRGEPIGTNNRCEVASASAVKPPTDTAFQACCEQRTCHPSLPRS